MRAFPAAAMLAVSALAAAPAVAQLYVCTTSSGRTITADRPPPECFDRPIRELRSDGSIRRVIEPPLTPEQKAQRAAEEKRRREQEEAMRAQLRRDRALLETYASADEIEQARDRALASRQVLIERSLKRIESYQRERVRLDNEAEFYANREMPDKLKRSYQSNAALTRAEEKIIADTRGDMQRINERFDEERKRFLQLIAEGATPVQRK
jgi:hypothetical protein